jgi:hypothetical protein
MFESANKKLGRSVKISCCSLQKEAHRIAHFDSGYKKKKKFAMFITRNENMTIINIYINDRI